MSATKDGREGVVVPLRDPCSICGDEGCLDLACLNDQIDRWVLEQDEARVAAALERDDELRVQAMIARREAERAEEGTPNDKGANRQAKSKRERFDVGDQVEIAERLLKILQGKSPAPPIHDDGALYRYEPIDGIWREVSIAQQSRVIQDFSGAPVGEKARDLKIGSNEVAGAIRLAGHRAAHEAYFTSEHAALGVAFANGFVALDDRGALSLRPHDPANRARFGFEFPFEIGSRPTMFLKFLHEVFEGDADRDEKIAFVQEFGGVALLGLGPRFQKCFVATSKGAGNGQNGKSQLTEVMCGIMPVGAVSCVRPQDLNNEYRRAELAGKLLNCVGEMPEGDILDSTSFKSVITGDRVDGRYIRQAPFWYFPRASHLYACNQPPGTSDYTRAFFRRFEFVTFNRVFSERDANYVPDIGKRIVRAERPVLAGWFLEGAVRALRQQRYTTIPSSEQEIAAWRRSTDQVAMFLDEFTQPSKSRAPTGSHDWSPASRVYDGYVAWARDSGHKPLAANKFSVRMAQANVAAVHTKQANYYPIKPLKGIWPTRTG